MTFNIQLKEINLFDPIGFTEGAYSCNGYFAERARPVLVHSVYTRVGIQDNLLLFIAYAEVKAVNIAVPGIIF